jgi:hypothetical protein
LPKERSEIKAAFKFMIDEGLIMNFSLLIARLTSSDIQNPLLVRKSKYLLILKEEYILGAGRLCRVF